MSANRFQLSEHESVSFVSPAADRNKKFFSWEFITGIVLFSSVLCLALWLCWKAFAAVLSLSSRGYIFRIGLGMSLMIICSVLMARYSETSSKAADVRSNLVKVYHDEEELRALQLKKNADAKKNRVAKYLSLSTHLAELSRDYLPEHNLDESQTITDLYHSKNKSLQALIHTCVTAGYNDAACVAIAEGIYNALLSYFVVFKGDDYTAIPDFWVNKLNNLSSVLSDVELTDSERNNLASHDSHLFQLYCHRFGLFYCLSTNWMFKDKDQAALIREDYSRYACEIIRDFSRGILEYMYHEIKAIQLDGKVRAALVGTITTTTPTENTVERHETTVAIEHNDGISHTQNSNSNDNGHNNSDGIKSSNHADNDGRSSNHNNNKSHIKRVSFAPLSIEVSWQAAT